MFQRPYQMVIVDDDPDLVEVLNGYVDDSFPGEFAVTCFCDPELALEHIKENPVLVVLTDVKMSKLNGDQLNYQIKSLHRGIQTIILTGGSNYTTTLTCFLDGADGYLLKPISSNDIKQALGVLLNQLRNWEKVFVKVTHTKSA